MNPGDMAVIRAGDVDLAVAEAGEGEPVVFVHGFPELAYSWRYQLPALAEAGYRAVAYDQRGYGRSAQPANIEAYTLSQLVKDLMNLADALGLDQFHLVGHDWGSIVSWTAAVLHPERLLTLTSLNVPYRGWCCGFPTLDRIEAELRDRFDYVLTFQPEGVVEEHFAADPERWLRRVYTSVALDQAFLDGDDFAVYLAAFTRNGISGPLNYYRNIDRNAAEYADYASAAINVPTLMITADRDPVLPARLADGMDRWIADLEVRPVAESGHWTQQEQPERVNRHLIDFLGQPRETGAGP